MVWKKATRSYLILRSDFREKKLLRWIDDDDESEPGMRLLDCWLIISWEDAEVEERLVEDHPASQIKASSSVSGSFCSSR